MSIHDSHIVWLCMDCCLDIPNLLSMKISLEGLISTIVLVLKMEGVVQNSMMVEVTVAVEVEMEEEEEVVVMKEIWMDEEQLKMKVDLIWKEVLMG